MYIHKAIKRALRHGRCICRRSRLRGHYMKYKPTHSRDCILMVWRDNGEIARQTKPRWNPTVEDLMADDWVVIS